MAQKDQKLVYLGYRIAGTIAVTIAAMLTSGCGAVGGAVLSGAATGVGISAWRDPPIWPFDKNTMIFDLKCQNEQTSIELTPHGAWLSQPDITVKFKRDYNARQELRYWRTTPTPQENPEFIVDEKSTQEVKMDWLVLLDEQSVHLEFDGVSRVCQIDSH
jgi:hypothetical protein